MIRESFSFPVFAGADRASIFTPLIVERPGVSLLAGLEV